MINKIFIILLFPSLLFGAAHFSRARNGFTVFQFSVTERYQLFDESRDVYGLRINLFGGKNKNVYGIDVGGVNNCRKMRGIQASVAWNVVQDSANTDGLPIVGLQFAGVFNLNSSVTPEEKLNFVLVQIAGIMNINYNNFHGVQVSGIINKNRDSFHGLQLSGIFNYAGDDVFGIQIASLFNYIEHGGLYGITATLGVNRVDLNYIEPYHHTAYKSNFTGLAFAGLINYITTGDFSGITLGGLINYAGEIRKGRGIMIAGLCNYHSGINSTSIFSGVQIAGLFNSAWGENTLQIAGLMNMGGSAGLQIAGLVNAGASGMQLSGLSNLALQEYTGAQLSVVSNFVSNFSIFGPHYDCNGAQVSLGLNFTGGTVYGTQIGLINIADRVSGVQIGLINITDRMAGIQIGIINIISEGAIPFMPIFNASMSL